MRLRSLLHISLPLSKDMLNNVRKAHQQLSQPAGSASVSADAGTAAKQD